MRDKKNFPSLAVILILVMVGVTAIVSCEQPTSADYDNPFDEKNPDFTPISSLSTIPVTQIGALQAVSGGEFSGISGYPITQKGICWDTNEQPNLDNNCTTEGSGATGFTSQLTDLQPDTRYFLRAYATNVQMTTYGEQREFRTGKGPQFEALTPSNVQAHSVQLNGQQTGDGFTTIQEVGFCVSVFGHPETDQCLAVSAPKIVSVMDLLSGNLGSGGLAQRSNMIAKMPVGSGNTADSKQEFTPTNQNSDNLTPPVGSGNNVVNPIPDIRGTTTVQTALSNGETQFFSLTITDLQADVRYLFRSYGMAGPVPFSSASRDVTTRNGSITLTTLEVIDISPTTATTGGEITDDGGSPVTARGVVWSTSENPTLESNLGQTSNGTGTGSFTSNLTGLTPGNTYYVRTFATNTVGTTYGAQVSFTASAIPPNLTTAAITAVTSTSAVSGGIISADGGSAVTERGVVWSTTPDPTVSSNMGLTTNGTGSGSFTSNLSGLKPGTTYFVRAYAKNSAGVAYGQEISFKTDAVLATVTTTAISSVTATTALSGGNITNDGGSPVTARGVVWSTSENPTLESKEGQTSNGTGTGSFTSNLTGLTPGATYYVRAYVINSVGTAYGVQLSFDAGSVPPSLITTDISAVTATSAVSGGVISADGGSAVTERGVVWSTSPDPIVGSNSGQTSNGSGTGSFTSNLTGLTTGTTYYVRAYAKNSAGIAYGQEIGFISGVVIPVVNTMIVTSIKAFSAVVAVNIPDDGGSPVTSRGVVWGTTENPTLTSNSGSSFNGGDKGYFTSNITGLTPGIKYYVRAFGTNSVGTSYGSQIVFTTAITITDIDGNIYETIQIGNQLWMAENLKVTRYRDGTAIPYVTDNTQWGNLKTGARSIYENISDNNTLYGQLYNWYAVNNSRQLCPIGWHVPTHEEWNQLTNFLGDNAGGKMKATGTQFWVSPNTDASNQSGFTGLPGGYRAISGNYTGLGSYGAWWSSSQIWMISAWGKTLSFNSGNLFSSEIPNELGLYVRCIRN
jgi:uncharacterized protein (TIGR02145 family)